MKKFNKYFDHTLLKADATEEAIIQLCREALDYDFASVCVNSCYVPLVSGELNGSDVKTAAVVGFPLGAMSKAAKAAEAEKAIEDGANEIDTVINIGFAKDGKFQLIRQELTLLSDICHRKNAELKVILETCLLTDEEIVNACLAAKAAGADFVKTSTGFSTGGATVADVKRMRQAVGDSMRIKASGGIRTLEDAMKMIEAGADRLGCSASVAIMKERLSSDLTSSHYTPI